MNIHIGVIAYAMDITSLVESLVADDVTFHVYLHSRIPVAVDACMSLAGRFGDHFDLHAHFTNRGLSTSWNDAILAGQESRADAIVILGDDILMSRDDLLKMVHAAIDNRDHGIVVVEGYDHHWKDHRQLHYNAFAVNPLALDQVGMFDENCVPYCFEDCDLSRRLALAGVPFYNVGPTGIQHLGSQSQTVPELRAQNQITFAATQAYYVRKWNGLPGHETFTYPFNDTRFGLRITAASRHHPYQEYDRQDIQEIVKL